MGAKSQAKGRRAELELARILQGYGYDVRPGEPLNYGKEADIVGLDGIHVEVKRHERAQIWEWMEQSKRDSKRFRDGTPVVIFRRSRSNWLICMELEDWLSLYEQAQGCGCCDRQKPPKTADERG